MYSQLVFITKWTPSGWSRASRWGQAHSAGFCFELMTVWTVHYPTMVNMDGEGMYYYILFWSDVPGWWRGPRCRPSYWGIYLASLGWWWSRSRCSQRDHSRLQDIPITRDVQHSKTHTNSLMLTLIIWATFKLQTTRIAVVFGTQIHAFPNLLKQHFLSFLPSTATLFLFLPARERRSLKISRR